MTDDRKFRQQVHQAVDAYAASAVVAPDVAERILARADRKESFPVKKKMTFAAILVAALLIFSLTALAIGLSAYDIWQNSFQKMNTSGEVRMLTEPTDSDMQVDEAIAIARAAIQDKYGTPDEELDAMGVYPTFIGREWEWGNGTDPDEWDIFFSSVTGEDIDFDYRDIGVDGEYRVYINAETKEVTYCHWYTDNFWARAQRIWDHGNHALVYGMYTASTFYTLSPEEQAHFEALFLQEGYALRDASERYLTILKNQGLQLLFRRAEEYDLDADDAQTHAAWQALEEQYGLPRALLEQYFFQSSRLGLNTGTDDIVICYNYEYEFLCQEDPDIDPALDELGYHARQLGFFLVSFRPGTTEVATLTHLPYSVWDRTESVTEGKLLEKTDWTAADLLAFDEAVEAYSDALARLKAAEATDMEYHVVKDAVHRALGDDPEMFNFTVEGYDVSKWFSNETAPAHSELRTMELAEQEELQRLREEACAQYGEDHKQWPLDVQARLMSNRSDRKEGELTRDEAIEKATAALIAEKGEDAIGEGWLIGVELMRDLGEGGEYSSWLVTFYAEDYSDGWWVQFFDTGADWQGTEITITNFSEGIG